MVAFECERAITAHLRETLHAIGSRDFAFDSTVDFQSDSAADRRQRYRP
jgi:hypothetical protein